MQFQALNIWRYCIEEGVHRLEMKEDLRMRRSGRSSAPQGGLAKLDDLCADARPVLELVEDAWAARRKKRR
jgi:hypothetical protein